MTAHTHMHHTPAAGKPGELAMCPVMHIAVNKKEAKAHGLTRTYKGQTYYLCCNTCTAMFDEDPEKYAGASDRDGGHTHDGAGNG